jgi:hypothetical protein
MPITRLIDEVPPAPCDHPCLLYDVCDYFELACDEFEQYVETGYRESRFTRHSPPKEIHPIPATREIYNRLFNEYRPSEDCKMRIKKVDIGSVIEYANNPRNNAASVDKVAASIEEYGWQQPIVVDAGMVVIAGHTRLFAAKKLGLEKVPVHVADKLSPEQVKAYRLADNRIGEDSAWDFELLALELSELKDAQLVTGFSDTELENLLSNDTPLLDDLDDRTDDSDFWPSIYVKVSPETKQRWDDLMEEVAQHVESETEGVELILSSVDRKSIAAV